MIQTTKTENREPEQKGMACEAEKAGPPKSLGEPDLASTPVHWHALTMEATMETMRSDFEQGLRSEECARRKQKFGDNSLHVQAETSWKLIFARQFLDVLVIVLVVAAITSFLVGEWADAVTILAIILVNGALGFFQEWKAERSIAALRELLTPTCQSLDLQNASSG